MTSIPHNTAVLFAVLAVIFLVLSATYGTPPAKKTWRRIGIIFALVALALLVVRAR
jgi:type IV secretory pathway VirB2 component (pilin)